MQQLKTFVQAKAQELNRSITPLVQARLPRSPFPITPLVQGGAPGPKAHDGEGGE